MMCSSKCKIFDSDHENIELGFGGDEGDRTPGLDIANVALSQLSYIPNLKNSRRTNGGKHILLIVAVSSHC